MRWPDLSEALRDIPWAVCGAVATRRYMPERGTADLDAMVESGNAAVAGQRLVAAGFAFEGTLAIGGSAWRSPDGLHVDVIERDDPWVADALLAASHNRDEQRLPILPLPYLVLTKLDASRAQDVADLARMLGAAAESDLELCRQVVNEFRPEDRDDLESLIRLGRLEQQGMG
ncbi:MAG: hypothetical protein HW416_971 [Chloroflexi bacterium]|nr:hypothetical protein [Chloroflexota bacterium]